MISLEELRAELAAAGDPAKAEQQQRYMKSAMPYHGLAAPELRALLRPHLKSFSPRPIERAGRGACAPGGTARPIARSGTPRSPWPATDRPGSWQDVDALELYRHLVVTGAWWDVVDEIAQHLVGACLLADRARVTDVMRAWAVDDDLWLRRTAVICQIAHGAEVDRDLLSFAIECNVDDTSFWLRKAVGWALRQHARIDPVWVREYVEGLGDRLSGLSRREATKHL